jgi:hypothetical protein
MLIIETRYPEKLTWKGDWLTMGDSQAVFDFTKMDKGDSFLMRVGKRKAYKLVR